MRPIEELDEETRRIDAEVARLNAKIAAEEKKSPDAKKMNPIAKLAQEAEFEQGRHPHREPERPVHFPDPAEGVEAQTQIQPQSEFHKHVTTAVEDAESEE